MVKNAARTDNQPQGQDTHLGHRFILLWRFKILGFRAQKLDVRTVLAEEYLDSIKGSEAVAAGWL